MKAWGDAKKFIFEDILIFSSVLVCDLFYDVFINFLYAVNLRRTGIPYDFGMLQTFVFLSFAVLLFRKIVHWRYYA